MKATRNWGPCACECGKSIGPGDEMVMFEGGMYLAGHEKERRTRRMNVIPTDTDGRSCCAESEPE